MPSFYVPSMAERITRRSKAGYNKEIELRNQQIYDEFHKGKPVYHIAKEQYLSISSIYRIIHSQNNDRNYNLNQKVR